MKAIVDRTLAKMLRDDGWLLAEIADYFNVSRQSIKCAVDDAYRARQYARISALQNNKRIPCEGCGDVRVWAHTKTRAGDGRRLCHGCRSDVRAVSVKENALRCGRCHKWLSDESFHKKAKAKARRGRHSQCKSCATEARREYRWKYAETCSLCGGLRGARESPSGLCQSCYQGKTKPHISTSSGLKVIDAERAWTAYWQAESEDAWATHAHRSIR